MEGAALATLCGIEEDLIYYIIIICGSAARRVTAVTCGDPVSKRVCDMPLNGVDSESPPPPMNHVLRPHHIGVLAIILLAYRRNAQPSPSFMLHMQRVLIEEIAEVWAEFSIPFGAYTETLGQLTVPRPYGQLVYDLTTRYSTTSPEVRGFERTIGNVVSCHALILSACKKFVIAKAFE
jgi:hypothetical protein